MHRCVCVCASVYAYRWFERVFAGWSSSFGSRQAGRTSAPIHTSNLARRTVKQSNTFVPFTFPRRRSRRGPEKERRVCSRDADRSLTTATGTAVSASREPLRVGSPRFLFASRPAFGVFLCLLAFLWARYCDGCPVLTMVPTARNLPFPLFTSATSAGQVSLVRFGFFHRRRRATFARTDTRTGGSSDLTLILVEKIMSSKSRYQEKKRDEQNCIDCGRRTAYVQSSMPVMCV